MVLPYLLGRALYRIRLFFSDWYWGSFRLISRAVIHILERFDRTWAVWITLKNIFQPLYQDHTFIGRILGFLFRCLRIIFGAFIYVFIIALGVVAYLIIAIAPIYILYLGFGKSI